MAAKLDRRVFQISIDRGKATRLANRLDAHAMGEVEMTATQVRAAEILLKKLVPDLASVELTGNEDNPVAVSHAIKVPLKEFQQPSNVDPDSTAG